MNIQALEGTLIPAVTATEPVVPLTERFASAWAGAYAHSAGELDAIHAASNDPHTASNPESLFRLQEQLQDYTKRMTVTAGLANHAVKGVETLLKS